MGQLNAQLLQLLQNPALDTRFVPSQFGMGVQISTDPDHVVFQFPRIVQNGLGIEPSKNASIW